MKFLGFVYIVLGVLIAGLSLAVMASDIQLNLAVCGMNMAGLGLMMRKR